MSIKEKFIKAKEKVVNFVEEHPKITAALVFMSCIAGAATLSAIRTEHYIGSEEWAELQAGILNDISKNDKEEWKKYEENWNKVNEFAETLHLLPGECFIIEDADEATPIVSHLVCNEGVYPPED